MCKPRLRRCYLNSISLLCCLAGPSAAPCFADLLAGDFRLSSVFRFDDVTGAEVVGGIAAGSGALESAAGVEVGPGGNIFVSSQDTGEILFFNSVSGAPLPSPIPGGRDGLFAVLRDADHLTGAPGGLRFGPDDNLYVSDFGGTTVRVFHGTTGEELAPAATGFGPPGGLTFAPNGDLYVGNFTTSAVVRIHDGQQQPFILSGSGPILTPSSLLFVPNGDLLVVSMFANEIHRYSAMGEYLGVFAELEPLVPVVGDTNYPSEIRFDADGNVVVAVLGATNPPDNAGQLLRYSLNEGIVEGTLLETLVDAYPPLSSVAWIRSPNAITGDFNSDGRVDTGDYEKWRADYGKWVAKGGGADGDGDGIIGAADYIVWRNAAFESNSAAAAAVPESTTLTFAFSAFLSASTPVTRCKRIFQGRRVVDASHDIDQLICSSSPAEKALE